MERHRDHWTDACTIGEVSFSSGRILAVSQCVHARNMFLIFHRAWNKNGRCKSSSFFFFAHIQKRCRDSHHRPNSAPSISRLSSLSTISGSRRIVSSRVWSIICTSQSLLFLWIIPKIVRVGRPWTSSSMVDVVNPEKRRRTVGTTAGGRREGCQVR
jgi:hypothetical protein